MILALPLGHATWTDAFDGAGENRVAPHQQAPRPLVVRLGHRMDAVKVTRA